MRKDQTLAAQEIRNLERAFDEAAAYCQALTVPGHAAVAPPQKPTGAMASMLMPAVDRTTQTYLRANVEWQLLRAGLAVALDGPEMLKKLTDPTDDKPFACEKTKLGFTLSSRMLVKDKALTLTFGSQK